MAAVQRTDAMPDTTEAGDEQCLARALLVPMREMPKQAIISQEYAIPSEHANCIVVAEAECCVGRRPAGAPLTCIVPEKWIAISSCHGFIRWKDGQIFFKDVSSNGTYRSHDHDSQESFSRLPKGEWQAMQMGDYIMFSQWSNNRTNDELLIYHIQPLPDKVTISYAKRSTGNATHGCLKTKTPKRQSKAPENTVGGALAPCKHCAKQAADALSARQELASVKHKCTALAKDLESLMEKSKDDAKEIHGLQAKVNHHDGLKEEVSCMKKELEKSRKAHDVAFAESKRKEDDLKSQLAKGREAAEKADVDRKALSDELKSAQDDVHRCKAQLKQAQDQAAAAEEKMRSELYKLKQQNKELQDEQEKRGNCEVEKLKLEHEAEIGRLQKVQVRLEKEAAAWRLKTETVSRTLPDALEKSMIPQLHKAARDCIQRLLQDVHALTDTTPSDLFGGTPTNVENPQANDRHDYAGHLGPSQHTVCFSSPGNLATAMPEARKTEMFDGATGGEPGLSLPSQEEQGPSVSLRHGLAMSQANAALNNADRGQCGKDPASPLLSGFMRSKEPPSESAQNADVEADVAGMTTDDTRVSGHKLEAVACAAGGKRKVGELSTSHDCLHEDEDAGKMAKHATEDQMVENERTKVADGSDRESMEDPAQSALAQTLKAYRQHEANNHETVAC